MILWKARHVPLILSGLKTETRRRGERRWREGAEHECFVRPAWSGGRPFAAVRIERVRAERLSAATETAARREGYASRALFLEAFREIHGLGADADPELWAVRFSLARVARPGSAGAVRWVPARDFPTPRGLVRIGARNGRPARGRRGEVLTAAEVDERDRAIVAAALAGATYGELSREWGITRARVGQIVALRASPAERAARRGRPRPAVSGPQES